MFRTRTNRTYTLIGVGVLAVALTGCSSKATPAASTQPSEVVPTTAELTPSPTIPITPTPATPTASSATTSPAGTPGPLSGNDARRDLSAGTYRVGDAFAVPFSITIASDWTVWSVAKGDVSMAKVVPETPDERPVWFTVDLIDNVYLDPCKGTAPAKPAVALTVAQVVTALTHMKGFKAGPVTEVMVGGHAGKAVELTNAIDTTADSCTGGGNLPMWTIRGGGYAATNDGGRDRITVVDVGGDPVVIDGTILQGAPGSAAAEIDGIIHAMVFK